MVFNCLRVFGMFHLFGLLLKAPGSGSFVTYSKVKGWLMYPNILQTRKRVWHVGERFGHLLVSLLLERQQVEEEQHEGEVQALGVKPQQNPQSTRPGVSSLWPASHSWLVEPLDPARFSGIW